MTLSRAGTVVSEDRIGAEPGAGVGENDPAATARPQVAGPALFADPQSRSLAKLLEKIAPTDVPVLIAGETGSGKQRLARYIHERSGRTGRFTVVQCGQVTGKEIPGLWRWGEATLLSQSQVGVGPAGEWDRGTVFLDDVTDLSPSHQYELLRTLRQNESSSRTAAGNEALPRVRIIASTTSDLDEAVASGRFRRDLLYRLDVASVKVLPLRQRPGDIAPLANHFLKLHSESGGLPARVLGQDAISAMHRYRWPGNVRELENVIRFALLTASRRELSVEDLRIEDHHSPGPGADAVLPHELREPTWDKLADLFAQVLLQNPGPHLLNEIEGLLVMEAFRSTGGNQVHTATLLGVSRNVVRTLLQKHGLLESRRRHQS